MKKLYRWIHAKNWTSFSKTNRVRITNNLELRLLWRCVCSNATKAQGLAMCPKSLLSPSNTGGLAQPMAPLPRDTAALADALSLSEAGCGDVFWLRRRSFLGVWWFLYLIPNWPDGSNPLHSWRWLGRGIHQKYVSFCFETSLLLFTEILGLLYHSSVTSDQKTKNWC